jgi:hypothetical protein
MLSKFWGYLTRKYIVCDVPDEMAACLDCNVVQCSHGEYETCPDRLTQAAALRSARTMTAGPARGLTTPGREPAA